jgi:murein DD-endopeptidase MepM/ murein hydrolase activator NlpD
VKSSSGSNHLRILLLFLLPFLLFVICSCTPQVEKVTSGETTGRQVAKPEAGAVTQPMAAVTQPAAAALQTSAMEVSRVKPTDVPYFTLTPRIVTASLTPVLSPTPTQSPTIEPVFRMCSPLEDHTLDDLLEIVSFPYDPPPEGKDTGHHGVDFAYYRRGDRLSILGVPITAVLPGKATGVVLNRAPYGHMLVVETNFKELSPVFLEYLEIAPDESLYLLYAHMDSPPFLQIGEHVDCGGQLGEVGNTPPEWSSAPHLHFEARIGPPGEVFESMAFYTKTASPEEMDTYRRWRMSGEFRLVDPLELLVFGLQKSGSGTGGN